MEYHDHDYVRPENRRAASPLPAEPPPTRTCWHTTCPMCGVPFPATPSATEPQRMANTNCWNWLHEIDLTLNTCLAVTVNPQAFDLPQVRANIDASRRAIESLKTLLNDALKAEP